MKMLLSDNNSGVHPKILDAIFECNVGDEPSYGNDKYTEKAIELIRKLFHKDVDVYFVTTGTAANIVGLSGVVASYEGVLAPDTGHINTDECGALENFSGTKILYVSNKDGKIYPEDVEEFLKSAGEEHQVQLKVISISQLTELGTAYTIREIRELADFAHANNMLLHMDGARIANAVIALDSNFKEMVTDTGVDLLSFGGTKNGMMMGEAIVSFNKDISKNFKYIRKQAMQLISKMRFISAQFIPYLEDEIWKENAIKANKMGQYLKGELIKISDVRVNGKTPGNMLFIKIPKEWNKFLEKKYPVHVIDGKDNIIRLVASFNTTKKDVDSFIDCIKKISE